jgi:hypothetical protein
MPPRKSKAALMGAKESATAAIYRSSKVTALRGLRCEWDHERQKSLNLSRRERADGLE